MENEVLVCVVFIIFLIVLLIILMMNSNGNAVKKPRAVVPNLASTEVVGPKHQAKVLLLSCIDFRFIDKISRFMDESGYRGDYDYFILAGASLGVNQQEFPEWSPTWWEHVDLALSLHSIQKIIVFGHEDCGAFRLIYPDADTRQ